MKALARRKNVSSSVIFEWVNFGLLPLPILGMNTYQFCKAASEDFERKYASLPESISILSVDEPTILSWVAEGKLKCESGPHLKGRTAYLFRRADIYKLKLSELMDKASRKRVDVAK